MRGSTFIFALALPMLLAGGAAAQSEKNETRFSLSLTDEASCYGGLRVPVPAAGNLILLQPSFAYRQGQRWRFSTSLAGLVATQGETHARLRVKETYFSVSAGDLDFTAGKKLLKWGTGYAFTPTGVLDPPRIATDPTDRLNLNEGREMVKADWIHGRHAISAAWASGGLLQQHTPGMRETTAFRYNTLLAGFDSSVIAAHDRGGTSFTGANFTRVFGEAVEIHGEWAKRFGSRKSIENGTAALVGGKYTTHSGWSAIAEYYSPPISGLAVPRAVPARGHYGFLRVSKSRLRELPGWKEWDVAASVVQSFKDGSRVVVLDAERRIRNHFSIYAHAQIPTGKPGRSEYGMIPYRSLVSTGFRFQL